MKKLLALGITVSMVMGIVTGCGGQKTAETKTGQAETKTETASGTVSAEKGTEGSPAGSGEPVYIDPDAANMTGTVRFYTAFAGANGTDALIEEFNEHYPNITVEYEVYKNSGDGNVSLDTAMMAGNVDVLLTFGVKNTSNRWSNGMLMDITDRLKADNLDLVKEWGTDVYTYENGAYVFPSGGISLYIAINQDKWDAAGLGEVPDSWTWDEYLDACRTLTEKDASGNVAVYGGSDFNQTDYWTYSARQSKGVNVYYDAEGNADFDNPIFKQILKREVDAETEGIWYSKANYLADSTKSRDLFLNGTNATTVESILTRYITAADPQFRITYAPYPVNQKDETNYMAGVVPEDFVAVASNAKDPDAAYAFAKYLATVGSKYMFAAGHASTWTGLDSSDILDITFGSKAEAEKYIDTEAFNKYVIASNEPAYSEDYIVAYADIRSLVDEYTKYVLNGEMTVDDALAELQENAQKAIDDAK
ncbi:hypothetical protein C0033_20865 [Clostridium sp. chh4-2]|uniref:ABC transporter substrate-binding protein n=1 Tax=Clostridium sp. chh4-2 TaxID=2067550 RepID=UPI000CCE5EAF|nr:extracellular solute-binding protein [Clostridium sp. chh4-2]PNV60111.1 hypothetical protein C0033_20865 [Clostridium sp. chh4-2]